MEYLVDEILFKKALNGDGESFYKLIEPIKGNLYKVAYVYVHNEEDALDCIHESIIKAIQSLNTVKSPEYFNTWMMKLTANKCKDYIRKNSKVVLVDINDYENILQAADNQSENKEDIKNALKKLTEEERDLIIMRYIQDMSLNDISSVTLKPLGTIKSKISRTLKKLKTHMEG